MSYTFMIYYAHARARCEKSYNIESGDYAIFFLSEVDSWKEENMVSCIVWDANFIENPGFKKYYVLVLG